MSFSDFSVSLWVPGIAKSQTARRVVRDTPIFVKIRTRRSTFVADVFTRAPKTLLPNTIKKGPQNKKSISKTTQEKRGAKTNHRNKRRTRCKERPRTKQKKTSRVRARARAGACGRAEDLRALLTWLSLPAGAELPPAAGGGGEVAVLGAPQSVEADGDPRR